MYDNIKEGTGWITYPLRASSLSATKTRTLTVSFQQWPMQNLKNSKIYVDLFPCNECAKAIIQSGIKKVIYKKRKHTQIEEASIKMFEAAGVEYISYDELT